MVCYFFISERGRVARVAGGRCALQASSFWTSAAPARRSRSSHRSTQSHGNIRSRATGSLRNFQFIIHLRL